MYTQPIQWYTKLLKTLRWLVGFSILNNEPVDPIPSLKSMDLHYNTAFSKLYSVKASEVIINGTRYNVKAML